MIFKFIVLLIALIQILVANETIKIEPIIDMRIEYLNLDKEYTKLGQMIYGEKTTNDADYLIGGKVGIKSFYENYNLAIAIMGLAKTKDKDESLKEHEDQFYNDNLVGYSYISDGYVGANFNNISTKIGRQSYNTSLVNENESITKNSYLGLAIDYKKDDFKIDGFYFNKIAASVLSTTVPQNHPYGILGYGYGYNVGEYTDISQYIIGSNKSTKGAINVNIKYGDDKTHLHIENLFVDNFFNTLSLTTRYNLKLKNSDINGKIGLATQNEVGDNHFGNNIDAKLYQGRLKFSIDNFYIAYRVSQTDTNKHALYNGTLISPFSNKLAWIRGSQTAHAFIADTLSQQLLLKNTFYFDKLPFTVITSYMQYKIGKNNGLQDTAMVTKESYINFKTYFSKNLTLTAQYSVAKNIDIVQSKINRTKIYLSYKF